MNCPKCKKNNKCGCKSCTDRNGSNGAFIWGSDGGEAKCFYCNEGTDYEVWCDLSEKEYQLLNK